MNSEQARASQPLLEVLGVYRSFRSPAGGTTDALRNVSMTVDDGEFVSLVGASGSGKSTLLRIIDGLIPATKGVVKVDGKSVAGPGTDRAMVFQQDNLLPWRSVIDNIAYGLVIGGMSTRDARAKAEHFVNLVGLNGFESFYPHQISGGMRQRANVARALAVDPKILLLDEPFAALDAQTREIMQRELLRIWSAQRKTVLFVTHQIDEAVFLSDRVVVFSARPGSVKEVIDVDLPRPRDLSLKRHEKFLSLVDRVWKLIEQEVLQAMGMTASANGRP